VRRALVALVCLAACKQRGTISIDLDLPDNCKTAATVKFQAVKGGRCSACDCNQCECPNVEDQQCVEPVDCDPSCTVEEAKGSGVAFDPPSAGSYALAYKFYDANGLQVGYVCVDVTVDADGTASSKPAGTRACCM
jgi:hypothetical protein